MTTVGSEKTPASFQAPPSEGRQARSILVVDDEAGLRQSLQRTLVRDFARVEAAPDAETAEVLHGQHPFDLLILDVRLPGKSGLEWLAELRDQGSPVTTICITAYADLDNSIQALRAGAVDFLVKPFRLEELRQSVNRALVAPGAQGAGAPLPAADAEPDRLKRDLAGTSPAVTRLREMVRRVAPLPSNLLLTGETGTGKEVVGRLIHDLSGREGPFTPVNCGAITTDLAESELFGHAKGAFTGAQQAHEGLFRHADGGTLLLDEIGEMSLELQAKLLRVLEEGTIRPVGASQEVPVDVRLLAASNRDLQAEVAGGRFRRDLFYRLNVVRVDLPPLRERREDIAVLVRQFIRSLAERTGTELGDLGEDCLRRMELHHWPGNARELRNVVERAVLLGQAPEDCIEDDGTDGPGPTQGQVSSPAYPEDLDLGEVERFHALRVLRAAGGNKSEAARRLGIGRKTLERKLRQWAEGPV